MDKDDMLNGIHEYVLHERQRRNVRSLGRIRRAELSGEAFGEFEMLLERQLMTTERGFGAWLDLAEPTILEGVYSVVRRRQTDDSSATKS